MRVELQAVVVRNAEGSAILLKNIFLKFAPGEVLGVVGPSGTGKTTLARIVAGARGWRASCRPARRHHDPAAQADRALISHRATHPDALDGGARELGAGPSAGNGRHKPSSRWWTGIIL
ncbi:ATP-binding cassette domain-containing protein [Sphingopyxis sp.]|uniref:ATP-binding cassette domain-containing protein n=1 Tax=Sphingopyxis sp. TaxID=1908224 RepID=UPI003D6D617D